MYASFSNHDHVLVLVCAQGRGRSKDDSRASGLGDVSAISLAQGADSEMFANMRGLLQSVTPFGTDAHVISDEDEHTVIRYGAQCSFRGRTVRTCPSSALL